MATGKKDFRSFRFGCENCNLLIQKGCGGKVEKAGPRLRDLDRSWDHTTLLPYLYMFPVASPSAPAAPTTTSFALVLLFLFWEETRRNLIILRTPRPLSAVPAMPRLERKEREPRCGPTIVGINCCAPLERVGDEGHAHTRM